MRAGSRPDPGAVMRRALTSLALGLATLFPSAVAGVLLAPAAAAAQGPDWLTPVAPFRIADDLYYVGSAGLASYLVTTPRGHILINSSLRESVPLIEESIRRLGFRLEDVKILLINHAHWDHDAGSAEIVRRTGARYMVMDGDVASVEDGGRSDFHYGSDSTTWKPPVRVDRVLHDGDTVALGGARLMAHRTAGHTPGTTTWTMTATDRGRPLAVMIVGSPNVNPGFRLVGNARYPAIAEDYAAGFRTMAALPCELFLGAHGAYFGMAAKVARISAGGENPFVDPEGCRRYLANRQAAFERELARQRAEAAPAR